MNSIGRSLKATKLSTPSPGLSGNGQLTKMERLRKYQEVEQLNDSDDIFGEVEDNLDEEFETLKISNNEFETLKGSLRYKSNRLPDRLRIPDLEFSPIDSISTSSPRLSILASNRRNGLTNVPKLVTRSTLSEYSEGDDTDITSQLNDDEFEDMDNIFGAGEAGIYNKMNQKLRAKQAELQANAEREELELQRRLHLNQQRQNLTNVDANATLKLRDFNQYNKNLTSENLNYHNRLDNDKTIDFEYTRDEFEDFEQGFDKNFENKISTAKNNKLTRFHSSSKLNPHFQPRPSDQIASMKKYKSTMDVGGLYRNKIGEMGDPGFKFDNRVKSRLERIPSFYNKTSQDHNKVKQEYLTKFQEQKLVEKEARKRKNNEPQSKVGLVRYLNNNSIVPVPKIPTSIHMKYNPISGTWEGNEVDLIRFENLQKPSLITLNDLTETIPAIEQKQTKPGHSSKEGDPHMIFDVDNLKWINTEEDNESIFNEIPDLEDNSSKPVYLLSSPPVLRLKPSGLNNEFQSPITGRGASQFTQRTISTNTKSGSSENEYEANDEFQISDRLMEKILREETKIKKKINHWFTVDEFYNFSKDEDFDRDYYWEIRKMVMETE